MVYLDDDPVVVTRRVDPVLVGRWERERVGPAFAAPFVKMQPWEWDRHGQPGAPTS